MRSQWGHYNLSRSIHTLLGVVMVMKKCAKAINVASSSVECALWWPFPKVFSTTTTWFSSKYLGVWPQPKRRTYKPKYNWTFSAPTWNIFFSSFLVNRPRPPTPPWILIPDPRDSGDSKRLEVTACHGSKNITLRSSLAQRRSDGPAAASNAYAAEMLMLLREREIREMMDMIVVI